MLWSAAFSFNNLIVYNKKSTLRIKTCFKSISVVSQSQQESIMQYLNFKSMLRQKFSELMAVFCHPTRSPVFPPSTIPATFDPHNQPPTYSPANSRPPEGSELAKFSCHKQSNQSLIIIVNIIRFKMHRGAKWQGSVPDAVPDTNVDAVADICI